MSIIKLSCNCMYSEQRKAIIKYCPTHLNQKIQSNINTQRQINDNLVQQQQEQEALNKEQRKKEFRFKPVFGVKKKIYLKPLF